MTLLPVLVCLLAAEPATDPIAALIRQLGNPAFRRREAAAKSLDAAGEPALDSLRKAAENHPDPEVRRRASELASRIGQRVDSARLLAPTVVHLALTNVTPAQAAAELSRQSGIPVTITGATESRLTFDTGRVPFWSAVEQLGRAAGVADRLPVLAPGIGQIRTGPVTLSVGKPVPAHVAGGVRIRPLPASRQNDSLVVPLEIAVETRIGYPTLTAVSVERAIDDSGRSLDALDGVLPGGLRLGSPRPQELGILVRLQDIDPPPKRLRELAGRVTLSVRSPVTELAVVADVQNPGGPVVGDSSVKLTVGAVKVGDNGEASVQLELVHPNEVRPPGGADQPIASRPGVPMPAVPVTRLPVTFDITPGLMLADAKGQPFRAERTPYHERRYGPGGIVSHKVTVVFKPTREHQGPPMRLAFRGTQPASADAAFVLKNIPLP